LRLLSIIPLLYFSFWLSSDPFVAKSEKFEIYIPENGRHLVVGEELTYEVNYSIMKLGKIVLKVRDKKEIKGKTYYQTVAYIDSYSGVPFVDLHQTYESYVNSDYFSNFFRGTIREKEPNTYTEYYFDYDKSQLRVKKGRYKPPKIWTDSTTLVDKEYQDGLSIFYFARMNLGTKKTLDIPCFVAEKKVNTKINFYDYVTDVSIDAVDYDIECLRLDGEAEFVSIFGLTGYFEGWFTNDEASIPVIAHMKVIIGNITLELVKWKRDGWNPPKYNG
jgi:hypothetical protein